MAFTLRSVSQSKKENKVTSRRQSALALLPLDLHPKSIHVPAFFHNFKSLSGADKMTIFSLIKNSETFICFVLLSIAFDLLASDGTLREFHSKTLDVADPLRNWRSVLLNSFTKTASSQAHQLASNKTRPESCQLQEGCLPKTEHP